MGERYFSVRSLLAAGCVNVLKARLSLTPKGSLLFFSLTAASHIVIGIILVVVCRSCFFKFGIQKGNNSVWHAMRPMTEGSAPCTDIASVRTSTISLIYGWCNTFFVSNVGGYLKTKDTNGNINLFASSLGNLSFLPLKWFATSFCRYETILGTSVHESIDTSKHFLNGSSTNATMWQQLWMNVRDTEPIVYPALVYPDGRVWCSFGLCCLFGWQSYVQPEYLIWLQSFKDCRLRMGNSFVLVISHSICSWSLFKMRWKAIGALALSSEWILL